jgi:hypothetical protein
MKKLALVAMSAAMFAVVGCESTQKTAAPGMLNSKCPFSGEAVDQNVTTSYGGGTVGFCCAGCKGKFESANDKAKADMLAKVKN